MFAMKKAFPIWKPFISTGVPMQARQREDQFSDGALRLVGLLWTLLEGDALLLLEEPAIVTEPQNRPKATPP